MKDVFEESELILAELNKFSQDMIYLGPKIHDDRIELFENKYELVLPFDFKYILKKHNGISLEGIEIYGIDVNLRGSSLDEIYKFEHFEIGNKMPSEFLPFSPDGRGNHYCLNLSKLNNGQCPIVFWQHDFIYNNINAVEECYDNLINWIKNEMIDWTLEDYNYDGTEKE